MKINLLDKFYGCLLGVAIGDTLGHPFEGKIRSQIFSYFKNFGVFLDSNSDLFRTYTDDTQLTLHLAKALIKGNGFNLDYIIREFVNWLDDPPIGPGYGCISSIQKLKYGIPWEQAASNSGGNGTVMRIAPVGLFYCKDPKALQTAAIKTSIITHSHSAASAGAIVIASAIAYLIDKNPETGFSVDEFFNVIINSISNSQDEIWEEFIEILYKLKSNLDMPLESGLIKFSQAGVKSPYFIEQYLGQAFVHPYTISTVVCTIFIFLKNLTSFSDCILELATAGGDSDTVGAIGGSLAGVYFGVENIPPNLIKLLKNKKKILKISEELYRVFEKRFLTGVI
ncbi:MAG: ADP-ribosylglycohydrolase family protein [Promethearchaeota archaeon]|nr:MAG: ADP-ribosylglycohydrolase family protein [Candidatus Lokiarchaeota archaeon]